MKKHLCCTVLLILSVGQAAVAEPATSRWSEEKARSWGRETPWLVGCNFIPSTAINQLEMWQADTFDLKTIDRELGWAQGLGFNSVRVFLHHLLWEQDREGFLKRMDQFLEVCERHGIGVMFVPFDAVWDPYPKLGRQREPRPHIHNSGWVQSPGAEALKDPGRLDGLEPYLKGVLTRFKDDRRVHVWDLFNEPDNRVPQYKDVELADKPERALVLMKKAFAWAREVNPSQPLTSGVWIGTWSDPAKLSPMERVQLEQSDVISFHSYARLDTVRKCVASLRRYQRPILCTEYMARPMGSTFDPVLGYFKEQRIGAYNWGFVSGKSQTIYPWDSWTRPYTAEPPVWFHDIFRPDGTPYRADEAAYIRGLTDRGGRQ